MQKDEKIWQAIVSLNSTINKHNERYFNLQKPTISDQEFDSLYLQLEAYYQKYPKWFHDLENNALQKIGASIKKRSAFQKFQHQELMLSLNKAHSFLQVTKFLEATYKKIKAPFNIIVEPKIDGLSIALHYQKGILKHAITRGDGQIGEDVFNNIKNLKEQYLPLKLSRPWDIEIRGEVYMPVDVFAKLNENENFNFANPRNAASGTLRLLDEKIFQERQLALIVYEIIAAQKYHLNSQIEILKFLEKEKFQILPFQLFQSTELQKLQSYLETYNRQTLKNTQIDGLVLKVNNLGFYSQLGQTAKFSHAQIAYKFSAIVKETTIKDIFVTVGKSGNVTYNAKLEATEIDGSVVSAATLHNHEYIKNLNLNLNDRVFVKKSGDIIPRIISLVNPKAKLDYFKLIKTCPYCKSSLIIPQGFMDQYCPNQNCPEILKRQIIYFVSRPAMNITTLGTKRLELLFEKGLVRSIIDLYELKKHKATLLKWEGFQEKLVNKILTNIEASKKLGIAKILVALGINKIGPVVIKNLIKNWNLAENNFLALLNYDFSHLNEINTFGKVITENLQTYFATSQAKELMSYFQNHDFVFLDENALEENQEPQLLSNLTFVISGTLTESRTHFQKLISNYGAKVASQVTKKTDYLLYGNNPGSKYQKAQAFGIKLLNEKQFYDLLK